jgi:hypothetical protein
MNPNFLLKDELVYELAIRGITSEGDTSLLRKLFRSIDTTEVQIQQEFFKSVSLDNWFSVIHTKICELQKLIVQGISTTAVVEPRVRTRLLHVQGRLSPLTEAGLCTSGEEERTVSGFQEKLKHIENLMHGIQQQERPTGEGPQLQPGMEEGNVPTKEVRLSAPNESRVFVSPVFQKLANPLTLLLKDVPMVDGNNTKLLK